jgi:hypothetical protein
MLRVIFLFKYSPKKMLKQSLGIRKKMELEYSINRN